MSSNGKEFTKEFLVKPNEVGKEVSDGDGTAKTKLFEFRRTSTTFENAMKREAKANAKD